MRRLSRFLLGILCVLVIFASVGWLTFWYYFDYKTEDLPDVATLKTNKLALATVVYDDAGRVIDKFALEDRAHLPFSRIPENVKNAIVAAEDKNFWSSRWISGIDIGGIVRAARDDLAAKKVVAGGSTITQQVAKLVWLSQEKTASRKFKEMRIAYQMEKRLSKELIFETYVNLVYMGHNRYGIAAGSQFYFGKTPDMLVVEEAALLAGLIKWPYKFSPLNNSEIARDRRNTILERMERNGFIIISKDGLQELKSAKLNLAHYRQDILAPYFSSYFMEELHRLGYKSVVTSGLSVHSTINSDIQRIANQALEKWLGTYEDEKGHKGYEARHKNRLVLYNIFSDYDLDSFDSFRADNWNGEIGIGSVIDGLVIEMNSERALVKIAGDRAVITTSSFAKIRQDVNDLTKVFKEGDVVILKITGIDREKNFTVEILQPRIEGAVVVVDVRTGAVKAMVGGRDFAASKYNRAMQAERQAGSTFKPFVYGAFFEKYPEKDLESEVKDIGRCFKTGNPKRPQWCPKNYEEKSLPKFMGKIPVRTAIARSRNVAAVRTAEEVGINNVVDLAYALGITSDLPRYLPTAIGAADVKVIDMATAFAAFFRQGVVKPYWFIERVIDKDNENKRFESAEIKQGLSKESANKILEAMRWVVLAGTGRSAARELPFAVAGKTGTTNNFTDAWFVGGTPRYVIAVWIGFDRKAVPLVSREAPQFKETGGFTALPIFIEIMKGIYKDKASDEFPEEIEAKIRGDAVPKKEEIKNPPPPLENSLSQ